MNYHDAQFIADDLFFRMGMMLGAVFAMAFACTFMICRRLDKIAQLLEKHERLAALAAFSAAEARGRIVGLTEAFPPCGCEGGFCEQDPETGAVFYGRLCAKHIDTLAAIRTTSGEPT